jgi:glyoxylase-like metal-dependent hydrolase (beta-lactamase superfamily II)
MGLPDIIDKFPNAKLCIHKQDFNDLFIMVDWLIEIFGQDEIDEWCRDDPELKKMIEFDPGLIGQPDIFLEDNMSFNLGEFEIKTIHTPGHSPGGICYYIDNMLFSGDVLFYRRVGRTDVLHSSREEMIQSVQSLYKSLPDETIVYPAHESNTDIGSEKYKNDEIRIDTVLTFN